MRRAMRRLIAGCMLLPFLLTTPTNPVLAQATAVSEYALKSVLFFKLPLFVYQPNAIRNSDLRMCLLGSNPFGGALEKLAQAPIDGRPVQVIRLSNPADASQCDFLFIPRNEADRLEDILRKLSTSTVVTVSDIEGFAAAGGMVELSLGDKGAAIRILINRKAAWKQNIEFNAQLLRLARLVGQ